MSPTEIRANVALIFLSKVEPETYEFWCARCNKRTKGVLANNVPRTQRSTGSGWETKHFIHLAVIYECCQRALRGEFEQRLTPPTGILAELTNSYGATLYLTEEFK